MSGHRFPDEFFWGTSTSAHQFEGGNRNDWSRWEKLNADRLARAAADALKGPKKYTSLPASAARPENYISAEAVGHYRQFEQDFDLAVSLGLNAFRLSLEWSRIEPRPGEIDQQQLDHYRKVIEALKQRKIEPFVCLWHWPLPLWLSDSNGWLRADSAEIFHRFALLCSRTFPEVKYWLTLNEPQIYAYNSFFKGIWPPAKKSFGKYLKVLSALSRAHKSAYSAIKKNNPAALVSIAKNIIYFEPQGMNPFNRMLAGWLHRKWNLEFLEGIRPELDFIGVNQYFHKVINFRMTDKSGVPRSDLGWELSPKAMFHALTGLNGFGLPLIIMENGLADASDQYRSWYIDDVLRNVAQARDQGIDVQGYFHWSLLDNFEWDKGFWPRFGLVEVDYKDLSRRPRPSFFSFARIIKQQEIDKDRQETER